MDAFLEKLKKSFVERFTSLMEDNGDSVTEAARIIGVAPEAVSTWLRGRIVPSIDYFAKIADVYNVSVDYLLGQSETQQIKDIPDEAAYPAVPARAFYTSALQLMAKQNSLISQQNALLQQKYHALSVLNQIIPHLMEYLGSETPYDVYATDGKSTKGFRIAKNVPKEHYTDAYCIACSILDADTKVSAPAEPFKLKQFRRHDRQSCIRQMVDRKYLLDGKVVATNRHKSIEQKSDSLEEFREAYGDAAVSQLTVRPHSPQYKDMARIMPGAVMDFDGIVGVFKGSSGRNNGTPNYYNSTKGARVLTKRCALLAKNAGMVFIPA